MQWGAGGTNLSLLTGGSKVRKKFQPGKEEQPGREEGGGRGGTGAGGGGWPALQPGDRRRRRGE